jgi:hypothetical protein
VESVVAVKPRVPYRRALELQMEAGVLLLQSSDQRDEGNLPAKLFEYLYARRPILFIGYERGIAARLVLERSAGLVSNSPARIRNQLQRWFEDKSAGRLERLDPSVSLGLSRDDQYAKIEHLFEERSTQLVDWRPARPGSSINPFVRQVPRPTKPSSGRMMMRSTRLRLVALHQSLTLFGSSWIPDRDGVPIRAAGITSGAGPGGQKIVRRYPKPA